MSRPNSELDWSLARRIVAVEAMTFARPSGLRGERVDRGLVQAGKRAERARDQMELVLDDQIRRRRPRGGRG